MTYTPQLTSDITNVTSCN